MPECHRCEWNQRGPSPEKEAACGSCFMAEDYTNHKGKVHVSIDSGAAQTAAEVEASLQNARERDEEEEAPLLPDCCMETAWRMLDYLSQLDERELKLLIEVSHGANLAEVGERAALSRLHGKGPMTRANVSHMWRQIVGRLPELAGVLETASSAQLREARAMMRERGKGEVKAKFENFAQGRDEGREGP